jgi:hypothetical protein
MSYRTAESRSTENSIRDATERSNSRATQNTLGAICTWKSAFCAVSLIQLQEENLLLLGAATDPSGRVDGLKGQSQIQWH